MSAIMSIGAVSYLNALPLIHGLPHAVETATPRELLSRLIQKKLSLAMLSTVCLFQYPELYLVPGMGICCKGPVKSVKLFFNKPGLTLQDLTTFKPSPESNTANMLARLLLRRPPNRCHCEERGPFATLRAGSAIQVTPIALNWVATAPAGPRNAGPRNDKQTEADAELVIGDSALTRVDSFGSVDLGEWWWEWTGLPFVFAGWISRSPTISKTLHDELLRCKSENLADIPRCIDSTTAFSKIPRPVQEAYLRDSIHYDIGEAELAGLNRFRDECVRAELIPNAHPIRLVMINA